MNIDVFIGCHLTPYNQYFSTMAQAHWQNIGFMITSYSIDFCTSLQQDKLLIGMFAAVLETLTA